MRDHKWPRRFARLRRFAGLGCFGVWRGNLSRNQLAHVAVASFCQIDMHFSADCSSRPPANKLWPNWVRFSPAESPSTAVNVHQRTRTIRFATHDLALML